MYMYLYNVLNCPYLEALLQKLCYETLTCFFFFAIPSLDSFRIRIVGHFGVNCFDKLVNASAK